MSYDLTAPAGGDAVLLDGTNLHVRPIEASDAERLVRFHEHLSDESVYMRFFSPHPHLSELEIDRFTRVDGASRMAFVATVQGDLVAVARYDQDPEETSQAEVAFVVADAWQGKGVGALLLECLAAHARTQGIHRLTAQTLAFNSKMQAVFRRSGFERKTRLEDGVLHVQLEIDPG